MLPHHLCSRLMGRLTNSTCTWWKNWSIQTFIRRYGVSLDDAIEQRIDHYKTFNEFFTRPLKPDARPITQDPHTLASPVDGILSEFGAIQENTLLQAKGRAYTLNQLMANNPGLSQTFDHGFYATFYLAPRDYHHIHMPIGGTLKTMWHIPGRLFSVNPATVAEVPGLFSRNERVICLFNTQFGDMALVLVGAFYVASIHTVWAGAVTPPTRSRVTRWDYPDTHDPNHIFLEKGMNMGHFQLGSTVIMLLAPNFSFTPQLEYLQNVRMGQSIGRIEKPS